MRIKNSFFLPAAALCLAAVTPAAAQHAGIAAGATVKDTSGGTVGTVARIDGDHYIVKTDRHEARLPASSFTPVDGSLLFGMTQAQLNAAVEQTKAQANAKIAPGAAVSGAAGAKLGTIESVDADFVTLKLSSGALVRLPRSAVGAGADGVVIGLTQAELQAASGEAGKPQGNGN